MKRLGVFVTGLLGIALAGGPAGSIRPAVAQQTQPAAQTQPDEGKTEDLEQRVKILERLREIEEEKAAEKAKETVTVSAGKDGFTVQSAGGNFILRLRGLLQFDGAFFQGDEADTATDIFQVTSARPMVEATACKIYDFKIVPDFGQGKTVAAGRHPGCPFPPRGQGAGRQVQDPLRPGAAPVGDRPDVRVAGPSHEPGPEPGPRDHASTERSWTGSSPTPAGSSTGSRTEAAATPTSTTARRRRPGSSSCRSRRPPCRGCRDSASAWG